MTESEHADLSRRLALALGYEPVSVRIEHGECRVYRLHRYMQEACKRSVPAAWHRFDYRQPDVALPVLEWLMREHGAWPGFYDGGFWVRVIGQCHHYDTLPEAIARAACAVKGIA